MIGLVLSLFFVATLAGEQKLPPSTCVTGCNSCFNNICYSCQGGYYLSQTTGLCTSCVQCTSTQWNQVACIAGGIVYDTTPGATNSLVGHYGSQGTCKSCSVCTAGNYQQTACTASADTVCTACSSSCQSRSPPGYLTQTCTGNHDSTCRACTNCVAGVSYVKTACSETADTVCRLCQTCPAKTYSSAACTLTSDTVCSACSVCGEGFFVSAACTATSNTVCQACTVCVEGQYEFSPCGDNVDTVCKPCSDPCLPQTPKSYETISCGANHDLTCAACTVCEDNFYEKTSCTEYSDTSCEACQVCPNGSFETAACTVTQDTVCTDCTECPLGWYIGQNCTATSDTVCHKCTECISGTFAASGCSDSENTVCQSCSDCPEEFYATEECSAALDTVCSPCTAPCNDDSFEALPCTPTSDRLCLPYSPSCTEYLQYISTPGTRTSDVVYTTCAQSCPAGQWLSASCTLYEDSTCSNCTVCGEGEYRVSPCGLDEDAVCADCSICSGNTILACGPNHDVICDSCPDGFFPLGYPFDYDSSEVQNCPVKEEFSYSLDGSETSYVDESPNHLADVQTFGDVEPSNGYTQINLGGFLNFPATPAILTNSFTFSWTVNLPPTSSRYVLLSDWSSGLWSFEVWFLPGNAIIVSLRRDIPTSGSDPEQGLLDVTSHVPANEWFDFAYNFDHATRTGSIYINGVLTASAVVRDSVTDVNLHQGSANYQWGVKADDGFFGQVVSGLKNIRIFTYSS